MCRSPCRHENQRCPPGESDEHDGGGDATRDADQTRGDEVDVEIHRGTRHAPIELARGCEILGEVGILQVSDAGRQARISASLSHRDTLLPRFMLTAVWIGFTISMSTNTSPVTASGPSTGEASWTALTVAPMATAKPRASHH